MKFRRTLLATATLAGFAGGAPALAQAVAQTSDSVAAPPAEPANEDIIVTAQKRNQMLIDVPQSISVVTGSALRTEHANSFEDYLKLVPGLQLNQDTPGEGRLILRGINTGGVASTVAVYADETPFGSSSGLVNGALLAGDFDTFDVARIEVLRGPQGTLYGASSLGGVLKFVTNAPDTDHLLIRARAGVESTAGGYLSYTGNLVVNLPIAEDFAIRASGYYRKLGGFIDSIGTGGSDIAKNINDSRSYGGRISALFTPTPAVSIRLNAILQNIDADAPSTVESDPVTLNTLYGRPTQSQFVPQFTDIAYRVYNGTATVDLGFANLTTSTSYSTQKQHFRTDYTFDLSPLIEAVFGTPNEVYLPQNTNLKRFTQELRLGSSGKGFLDWLIGGYYDHETGIIRQSYVAITPGTLTPVAGLPLLAAVQVPSSYQELAGFADATLHFGSHFDLEFGGRYSHNRQHASETTDGVLAGGAANFPTTRSSEGVFTYSVAPKIKLSHQASIYGRVAKGFRPGGPNVLPANAPAGTPRTYRSDSLISYEIGVKAQTRDGSFGIDVAAFHLDWSNIQLLGIVNNYGINVNGAGAKSDGFEANATLHPAAGFTFTANAAYTNARLTGDTSPLVGGMRGDNLPFTPKFSVGLDGTYSWALSGTTKAYLGGSLRFLSKQPAEFDATFRATYGRQHELPSYTVGDLRAGVDFGRFSIEAYAKNIGNAEGKTSTTPQTANGSDLYPNGAIATGVIRPRTIGLSLTAEY